MIGIATFSKSINNGSVLQAWALQNVFKDLEIPNEVIDYTPQHYDEIYSYFDSWKSPRTAFRNLAKIPFYARVKRQRRDYQEFHHQYLCESKEQYYFNSDFSALNKNIRLLFAAVIKYAILTLEMQILFILCQ